MRPVAAALRRRYEGLALHLTGGDRRYIAGGMEARSKSSGIG